MVSLIHDTHKEKKQNQKGDTQLSLAWKEFRRHKLALVSVGFLPLLMLVAIFAKWIVPYDPLETHPELSMGIPQPPSTQHWLGLDTFGRDILSRLIIGAKISLSVGFVSVGISLILGVILGSAAGFFGGFLDTFITRAADVFLSVPRLFLIMIVNSYLSPSIYNVMAVIGVFGWMTIARLVRGEFLKLKSLDYVSASTALGASPLYIITTHLLPNSFAPIIVAATIGIPFAILLESSLSFLGLGVPPPAASWGNMLFEAKTWLNSAWWFWVPPGLLISLTVICFNFVGDGLRTAFDPKQYRK
jgi:peptide/nickel transport system permease protein